MIYTMLTTKKLLIEVKTNVFDIFNVFSDHIFGPGGNLMSKMKWYNWVAVGIAIFLILMSR